MAEESSTKIKKEHKSHFSTRFIPNFLTLFALSVGLTALRFGILEKWTEAAIFVMIAAVLDGLDGFVARRLDASSEFGAELDSFADFVSFGVTPAILIYLWILNNNGSIGWLATLIYCIAVALRLARFNSSLGRSKDLTTAFFEGVPAPAGAILVMLPIFIANQFMDGSTADIPVLYVEIWMIFIAGLMVSKLPTYSLKNLNLNLGTKQRILLGVSSLIFCAALAIAPWTTILMSSFVYLGAIIYTSKGCRFKFRK